MSAAGGMLRAAGQINKEYERLEAAQFFNKMNYKTQDKLFLMQIYSVNQNKCSHNIGQMIYFVSHFSICKGESFMHAYRCFYC